MKIAYQDSTRQRLIAQLYETMDQRGVTGLYPIGSIKEFQLGIGAP